MVLLLGLGDIGILVPDTLYRAVPFIVILIS